MSLVGFHRILILVGIAFCVGYGIYEGLRAARGADSALMAALFLAFALLLVRYYMRLGTWLREPEPPSAEENLG